MRQAMGGSMGQSVAMGVGMRQAVGGSMGWLNGWCCTKRRRRSWLAAIGGRPVAMGGSIQEDRS